MYVQIVAKYSYLFRQINPELCDEGLSQWQQTNMLTNNFTAIAF